MKDILAVIIGYLLGSLSVSILLTRLKFRTDVRTQGSGNAGATNVARVFGMKAGALTLAGDMVKTAAAMGAGFWLDGEVGMAAAGCACMLGHCFPVFFHFKGGKGISVGAMIALFVDWRAFVFVVGLFILFVAITRIVSVGSIAAAAGLPVIALILHCDPPRLILSFFTGALALFMHRSNMVRLVRHEEKTFQPKK